jgi:hypothetical protein
MTEYEHAFLDFAKKLKTLVVPYKTNLEKIRIGPPGDGGYVVSKLPGYDCLYSYGSNDDIKFECAFHELYETQSYVYDHTIEAITDKPDHITFFKEGVWHSKGNDMDSMHNQIITNGHQDKTNMFLKMDIEGCEWVALNASAQDLTKFSQIAMEFHFPNEFPRYYAIILKTFETLNENFVCTHLHGTNCPLQPWFDHDFPRVFEATYVRKDLVESQEIDPEPYPKEGLDYPTDLTRPDMTLKWWLHK